MITSRLSPLCTSDDRRTPSRTNPAFSATRCDAFVLDVGPELEAAERLARQAPSGRRARAPASRRPALAPPVSPSSRPRRSRRRDADADRSEQLAARPVHHGEALLLSPTRAMRERRPPCRARACASSAGSRGPGRRPRSPAHRRPRTAAAERRRLRASRRVMRVVRAELVAQGVADLADRAVRRERLPHRRKEVVGFPRGVAHPRERRLRGRRVALGRTDAVVRSTWRRSASGSRRCSSISSSPSSSTKRLTPTTTCSPLSSCALVLVRGLLDLVLREALLDRRDRAAELVDRARSTPRRAPPARASGTRGSRRRRAGSAVSVPPASFASTCCVRSAMRAARSVGSASASS